MKPWEWPTYGEWALCWLGLMATPVGVYYLMLTSNLIKIMHRRGHVGED